MAQKTKAMYSRGSASGYGKTFVPGIDEGLRGTAKVKISGENPKNEKQLASSEPVVGFLYSISRTAAGEYWPLHLGENKIGRGSSCDICLPEMTVSEDHATLVVRRMKTTNEYLMDLYVKGVNGAFVNETEVRREAECKGGDFLTIGDNYILYIILINPFELGLKVSEAFVPAEEQSEPEDSPYGQDSFQQAPSRTSGLYDSRRRASGGTEGMDGTDPIIEGQTSIL